MRMCRRLLTIPPITGVASGFITSAPVRVLHMIGSRLATIVATVMTFGRRRRRAPSLTAAIRSATAEGRAALAPFSFQRFLEIDDHHHAGLDRRAEERDVADPDGDAEIVAEQVLQKDAAAQRERHGEDDVRGFLRVAIDDVEQQEDDEEHARHDDPQRLRRADLVLEFAAVFDGHAFRQCGTISRSMRAFTSSTKPPRSRSCTLACTKTRSRPFSLAISLGPFHAPDLRDLAERNDFAGRCGDEHVPEAREVFAFARARAAPGSDSAPAFDGRRDVLSAEPGFDGVEDVLRLQSVARHRLAIHFDFEKRLALHPARRDAGRAGHFADDALDLERLRCSASRSSPRILTPSCARMPVEIIRMRFSIGWRKPGTIPGTCLSFSVSSSTSFCFVMPGRHSLSRLEHDRRLDHLDRRGIGGGFRAAELAGGGERLPAFP